MPAPKKVMSSAKKIEEKVETFENRVQKMYTTYADAPSEEGEFIGPAGVERLCTDLDLAPDSLEILCLCHALKATTMGYFSKAEFVDGLTSLRADSVQALKKKASSLVSGLSDAKAYRQVYEYSFNFCKGDAEKKLIDLETAAAMLTVVMGDRYPFKDMFLEFLKQSSVKGLNTDQWMCFLEFSKSTKKDLVNYDDNSSWPILLDDFVEWIRKNQTKQSKK